MPRAIFTQPGMRYCQAQALVFAIGADRRKRFLLVSAALLAVVFLTLLIVLL